MNTFEEALDRPGVRCGGGCGRRVRGIYCPDCRAKRAEILTAPAFVKGQKVTFAYRGTTKEGIVERVGNVNAVVLIEVNNGKKRKFVKAPIAALTGVA